MSSFTVQCVRISEVLPHPDADRLDYVQVGGYQAVVQKGRFAPGDLAVYVPEGAVIPEDVLRWSNFWDEERGKGMLAGPAGDRVKAVRLRGLLSQGIFVVPDFPIFEGEDYATALGIVKYSPPIPAHLAGDVFDAGIGNFSYTDIENIKRYPDIITPGEEVVMTEKLHGTCCVFQTHEGKLLVSSKGMSAKGLAITENDTNFYWRVARRYGVLEALLSLEPESEVAVYAEGLAVQDLKYGYAGSDAEARFFDMARISASGERVYLPPSDARFYLANIGLPTVPLAYSGPFSQNALAEHTAGKTMLDADHVREGIVVQPVVPRRHEEVGRVILKSVSDQYLTRKGDATEYE